MDHRIPYLVLCGYGTKARGKLIFLFCYFYVSGRFLQKHVSCVYSLVLHENGLRATIWVSMVSVSPQNNSTGHQKDVSLLFVSQQIQSAFTETSIKSRDSWLITHRVRGYSLLVHSHRISPKAEAPILTHWSKAWCGEEASAAYVDLMTVWLIGRVSLLRCTVSRSPQVC
jgi:hypothetical protein